MAFAGNTNAVRRSGRRTPMRPLTRQEPYVAPINGIVQPPVMPSPHRPGRNTNQLQYIAEHALKPVWNHAHAEPFRFPVNAENENFRDYHSIIKYPMDLSTIRMRLENCYYWTAGECLEDFVIMFENCFLYHRPGERIVLMALILERILQSKIANMPSDEIVLNAPMPLTSENADVPIQEPYAGPINEVVQPPVMPSPHRPGRNTNQLQYIAEHVLKPVWNHAHAEPFRFPVSAENEDFPDYHRIIMYPMDLNTIRMRLENCYYWTAGECLEDFAIMFQNCFLYHRPGERIVLMALILERILQSKIAKMPSDEIVLNDAPMPLTSENADVPVVVASTSRR